MWVQRLSWLVLKLQGLSVLIVNISSFPTQFPKNRSYTSEQNRPNMSVYPSLEDMKVDHMMQVQSLNLDKVRKSEISATMPSLLIWYDCKPLNFPLWYKGRGQLKKNVFFRTLPELPKPPPPMTPIRATWSSFFGSQNSRFESQFRTKNTIYTI